MKAATRLPQSDSISGVTYSAKSGKILRVQFGRNLIMDLEHLERRNVYGKKTRHPIDKKDAQTIARQARRWLQPPPGSVPINSSPNGQNRL